MTNGNNKATIVMIDDEDFYLKNYQKLLRDEYQFHGSTDIDQGMQLIEIHKPEILLLDITFSPQKKEGLDALPQIREKFPGLKVIMVTNWDSLLISREAMDFGADDYFIKSESISRLKDIIQNLLFLPTITDSTNGLIAVSTQMREILKQAKRYAVSMSDILITGETGVGKEVVAKYIHRHSRRCNKPFVALNSAAIESNLIGSELFGHERGAFTGAVTRRIGKFEEVDGGTLFLDEIAELHQEDQAKLLRAIENKTIQRIGSNKDITLDVRIIAATNASLKDQMEEGLFRKDLYYRLGVCHIHIPPLREREDDIIPLSQYFLQQAIEKNGYCKKVFTPNALLTLKNYHWGGNVRELKNVIEEAVVSASGKEITARQLKLRELSLDKPEPFKLAKKEFERFYIKNALVNHLGNISATAKAIGISRQALQKKIAELGLDVKYL